MFGATWMQAAKRVAMRNEQSSDAACLMLETT
jgi:hypothetical protein